MDPKEKETSVDEEDEARIDNMISEGGPVAPEPEEEPQENQKQVEETA